METHVRTSTRTNTSTSKQEHRSKSKYIFNPSKDSSPRLKIRHAHPLSIKPERYETMKNMLHSFEQGIVVVYYHSTIVLRRTGLVCRGRSRSSVV